MWQRPRRIRRGPRGSGICGIDAANFDFQSVVQLLNHGDIHKHFHDDIHAIDSGDSGATADQLIHSEHTFLQGG